MKHVEALVPVVFGILSDLSHHALLPQQAEPVDDVRGQRFFKDEEQLFHTSHLETLDGLGLGIGIASAGAPKPGRARLMRAFS